MKIQNIGTTVAIAAGVGTAMGVALDNTAVGFAIGMAIFVAFRAFGNSWKKDK